MSDDAAVSRHHPRTAEFDAFGPWIDEVRTPEEIPPLFRSFGLDLAGAALVLKVPRNIDRRDATPDMNLYDHLLVAGPDALTVLTRVPSGDGSGRRGEDYRVRTVAFGQIAAVQDSASLLDGRIEIIVDDGNRLAVGYNGSARDSVTRLVELLRAATTTDAPTAVGRALLGAASPQDVPRLAEREIGLVNDFREIARHDPALRAWAWHERQPVALRADASTVVSRLTHLVSPMTLHGAVVAGSDTVLELVGRRSWLRRGRGPEHSSARTVVPLSRIDAITVEDHPRYEDATSVRLHRGAANLDIVVPTGSDAARLFARAGG